MTFKKTNKALWIILSLIFAVYLLTTKASWGNKFPQVNTATDININAPPFESSQERARYAQAESLIRSRTFAINEFSHYAKPDLAWYGGNFYPAYPPGVTLLIVPAYAIGSALNANQFFSYVTMTFVTLITILLAIDILKLLKIDRQVVNISIFSYAFASIVWVYSLTIFAHVVSGLLILLAYWCYLKIRSIVDNLRYFILLWFIVGACFFVDYPNLLIIAPIVFFSLLSNCKYEELEDSKRIKIYVPLLQSIPFMFLAIAPYMIYSMVLFHKPVAMTNTYNLQRLQIQGVEYEEDNLSNSLFEKKSYVLRFSSEQLKTGLQVLIFHQDRGILIYAPLLSLSLLASLFIYRHHKQYLIPIYLSVIFCFVIFGSFDDPWGGWSFGPRYLIPIMPLLLIVFSITLNRFISNVAVKYGVMVVGIVSIFITGLGAFTTNIMPPTTEVPHELWKASFLYNLDLLRRGESFTFAHNTFFKPYVSPFITYLFVSAFLSGVFSVIVFNKKLSYENQDR